MTKHLFKSDYCISWRTLSQRPLPASMLADFGFTTTQGDRFYRSIDTNQVYCRNQHGVWFIADNAVRADT